MNRKKIQSLPRKMFVFFKLYYRQCLVSTPVSSQIHLNNMKLDNGRSFQNNLFYEQKAFHVTVR